MTKSKGIGISKACRLNASSSCNVTVERIPAEPTPITEAPNKSGFCVGEQSMISPSPEITRALITCVPRQPNPIPVPWVPVEIAPAID